MNCLITGAAGYIGSFAVRRLCELGHQVVAIDNLSKGFRQAVDKRAAFVEADVGDGAAIQKALETHRPEVALHFAAFIEVGESVKNPQKYFENNFEKALRFAEVAAKNGTKKFILSSTAAVYGNPQSDLITEEHPLVPVNPYGQSKAKLEGALTALSERTGMAIAFLRYFNVAGADPDGNLGEAHEPETHLIPNVIKSALGQGPKLKIFGNDYPTRDGTCIRDYVHVIDLIDAHILALNALQPAERRIYNLGSESGFSVLEVIQAAEKALKKKIDFDIVDRRAGDPATLVASSQKIRSELGWKPKYPEIEEMIQHAFRWHSKNPTGYKSLS